MSDKQDTKFSESTSVNRSILLALIMFVTMCAHYIYKSGINGLLVKAFTAKKMPWFDIADAALCGLVVGGLFIIRFFRLRLSLSIGWFSILTSCVLGVFGLIWHPGLHDKFHLFIVGLSGSFLVSMATYGVWMLLVNTAFRRNWLTLSIVGFGAQAGVLAGSWFGKICATPERIIWLPAIVGFIYIIVFFLLGFAMQSFSCAGTILISAEKEPVATGSPSNSEEKSFRGISFYLGLIFFLILVGSMYGRAINWRLQLMADYKTSVKEATVFFGDFYQLTAVIMLFFQLFITPLMLRFVPDKIGLVLQPLLGIIVAFLVINNVTMNIDIIGIVVFTSFDFTIYNAFKERLWLHVPLFNKIYHKAIAALLIPKLAALLSAFGILFFAVQNFKTWAIFIILLAIMWTAIAYIAGKYYYKYKKVPIADYKYSVDAV